MMASKIPFPTPPGKTNGELLYEVEELKEALQKALKQIGELSEKVVFGERVARELAETKEEFKELRAQMHKVLGDVHERMDVFGGELSKVSSSAAHAPAPAPAPASAMAAKQEQEKQESRSFGIPRQLYDGLMRDYNEHGTTFVLEGVVPVAKEGEEGDLTTQAKAALVERGAYPGVKLLSAQREEGGKVVVKVASKWDTNSVARARTRGSSESINQMLGPVEEALVKVMREEAQHIKGQVQFVRASMRVNGRPMPMSQAAIQAGMEVVARRAATSKPVTQASKDINQRRFQEMKKVLMKVQEQMQGADGVSASSPPESTDEANMGSTEAGLGDQAASQ